MKSEVQKRVLEDAKHRLYRYVRGGRIHHALILSTESPSLGLSIAKNLAQHLLCTTRGTSLLCGKCSSCRRIEKEIHPDVFYVRDEEEGILKIEKIRSVCHQMEITPLEGVAKVCIIEECQRMNAASANAFLKTLEEPGVNRYFILITSQPAALLPTVLSRCVLFSVRSENADIAEEQNQYAEILTDYFKTKSAGSIASALSDKNKAAGFVKYLQQQLRQATAAPYLGVAVPTVFSEFSSYRLLHLFEGALQLEKRFHSNANCGLLVEDYLRQNLR